MHIMQSTTSAHIIKNLDKTFITHGYPSEIVTDNAQNLKSVEIKHYCEQLGIHHRKIGPYWPKANAPIERFYRTLGKAIKTFNVEGKNWRTEIFKFLFQYRTTPHCSTSISPAEILMGRKLRGKIPFMPAEDSSTLKQAKKHDKIHKNRMKEYSDTKYSAKYSDIKIGDYVLLKQRKLNKLTTNFDIKPYQVTDRKGNIVKFQETVRHI